MEGVLRDAGHRMSEVLTGHHRRSSLAIGEQCGRLRSALEAVSDAVGPSLVADDVDALQRDLAGVDQDVHTVCTTYGLVWCDAWLALLQLGDVDWDLCRQWSRDRLQALWEWKSRRQRRADAEPHGVLHVTVDTPSTADDFVVLKTAQASFRVEGNGSSYALSLSGAPSSGALVNTTRPGSPTSVPSRPPGPLHPERRRPPRLTYAEQDEQQQRATTVTKKLHIYKKRNLSRMKRTPDDDNMTTAAASRAESPEPTRPVRVVYRKPPTATTPPVNGSRRVASPTATVATAPMTYPPPGSLLHSTTFHQYTNPTLGGNPRHSQEFRDALRNLDKIWISRRAQETEEMLQDREFRDTVTMFQYNRARIEEEVNRRQESLQMSSQIASCHRIRRRTPLGVQSPTAKASREQESTVVKLQSDKQHDGDQQLVGGWDKMTAGRSPTPEKSGGDLGPILSAFYRQTPPPGDKRTNSKSPLVVPLPKLSLSPYDHVSHHVGETVGSGFGSMMLSPQGSAAIITPDTARAEEMRNLGLRPTHPTCIRGTSFLNGSLDIACTPSTVVAPSMLATLGRLPQQVALEPAAPSRPASRVPGVPRRKKKNSKDNENIKYVDPSLLDQIFPVLSVEQEVPSLHRMSQLHEVELVREAFARQGVCVPTNIVEDALLTPEDRPYLECLTNLPSPDHGIAQDYTAPRRKEKRRK